MTTKRIKREPMTADHWARNFIILLASDHDKWSNEECEKVEKILWKAAGLMRASNNLRRKL